MFSVNVHIFAAPQCLDVPWRSVVVLQCPTNSLCHNAISPGMQFCVTALYLINVCVVLQCAVLSCM